MLLRQAVEKSGRSTDISSGALADKLSRYAELLAAEGNLATAANYLGSSNEVSIRS